MKKNSSLIVIAFLAVMMGASCKKDIAGNDSTAGNKQKPAK